MVYEFTTPEIIREARKLARGMPLCFPEKTVAPEPHIRLQHPRVGNFAVGNVKSLQNLPIVSRGKESMISFVK